MDSFRIKIQRQRNGRWPLKLTWQKAGSLSPVSPDNLSLNPPANFKTELLQVEQQPERYG